jgi:peptidoglycan/LPS O-acetylase OafA/YrhL
VTIFCAVSGYFALGSEGSHARWLWRRLQKIYPPYWVVLAAILAANQVVRYKPVTWGLVVSEALGTAYFTHPGRIVGVHLWFISLILLCYGVAVFVRWNRWLLPACAAVTIGLMPRSPLLAPHVLSFLSGAALAVTAGSWQGATTLGLALGSAAAGAVYGRGFDYPLAGAIALAVGQSLPWDSPRAVASVSRLTYEFYLAHGPIYLVMSKLPGSRLAVTFLAGTLLAIVASWALHEATIALTTAARLRLPRAVRLGYTPGHPPGLVEDRASS